MFRATIARNARLFSTNARLQKTATEQVKEGLETVNRKVSDALGSAIDAGGKSPTDYISFCPTSWSACLRILRARVRIKQSFGCAKPSQTLNYCPIAHSLTRFFRVCSPTSQGSRRCRIQGSPGQRQRGCRQGTRKRQRPDRQGEGSRRVGNGLSERGGWPGQRQGL